MEMPSKARGAKRQMDVHDQAWQCDVCRDSLHVLGLGDCPQCVFTEVVDEAMATEKTIVMNDDDEGGKIQCDICCGNRCIPGFGTCPKCITDVERVDAELDSGCSSQTLKRCDVCCSSGQIHGVGSCPKCTRTSSSHSSQQQVRSDHAVAELLARKEESEAKISQLQANTDRAVAELLEMKDGKEAQIDALALELDETKKRMACGISDVWYRFATIDEDVSDEAKVRAFFERRQQGRKRRQQRTPALQIQQCIKVENHRLFAFTPKPGNRPTLIFHGTPERNVGNIMVEGLLMEFCSGCGGIFGAMHPQTSLDYAMKDGDQRCFMALCVYDLPPGMHASPQVGAEVNVPTDDAATVLWLLKVVR